MANISFRHVKKTYDNGVTVVPDLNLEIKDKEFVVLVGPSGCGKSTTLRMIAGLEDISDGELWIGDTMINYVAPKDRDIAMVFQSYALYPHMSVYENMAFALKLNKIPKEEIRQKVQWAAEILGLEPYLDRKPKELSGGQRQRVALGRAMVRNPKVFLLDEPLSNLDAKLRTDMRSQISQLHRKLETTFVYVTHDQTEAMTMGDRIVVMKDGVIQQFDTPQTLYSKPCNMFVAGFIGTPQMNFIDAKVDRAAEPDTYTLTLGAGSGAAGAAAASDTDAAAASANAGAVLTVKRPELKDYVGKTVVAGIRPEDVHAEEEWTSRDRAANLNGICTVSELMGYERNVYIEYNGSRIISKVPAEIEVKVDDRIELAINTAKMHLFDKETEEVIR